MLNPNCHDKPICSSLKFLCGFRYAKVPVLYDSVQPFHDGEPTVGQFASFRGGRNPEAQLRQPAASTGYQHAYPGHVSQPPYTQSPIPFNAASPVPYSVPQQEREKVHINQNGVVYEANREGNEEIQVSLSNTSHANHYHNYPMSQNSTQQFYAPEQTYHIQYPQTYHHHGNNVNEQQGYYDDQGQYYGVELTENDFAATNLILSPADSEPGDYKRRLEQQMGHQSAKPAGYYGNSSEAENQHFLNAETSGAKPVEDDSSVAKLSTIREEMDADEVVAGIDRLLL